MVLGGESISSEADDQVHPRTLEELVESDEARLVAPAHSVSTFLCRQFSELRAGNDDGERRAFRGS